ncbi:MAG: hypothetical protein RBR97_14980, partial [Bacteroidales bacterium]|nr:hypothetical protein [Bacteroidales bacterium]
MKKIIVLLGFVFLNSIFIIAQTTLNVGTTQTYTTISAAIVAANNGDTINIVDAVHSESGGSTGILIDKSVIIKGQGADKTVIDGQGFGRIFYTSAANVIIMDLTLQNGKALDGAFNFGSPGENGQDGGAIYNDGSLIVRRCVLQNNSAGNGGDGSDGDPGNPGFQTGFPGVEDGMPGMPGFDGGNAGKGGAIYNAGDLYIKNSLFTNNTT